MYLFLELYLKGSSGTCISVPFSVGKVVIEEDIVAEGYLEMLTFLEAIHPVSNPKHSPGGCVVFPHFAASDLSNTEVQLLFNLETKQVPSG